MDLNDLVDYYRLDADRKLASSRRSEYGQFFTTSEVSQLLASMFSEHPRALKILDPGAGVGSLSAALISEACSWGPKPESISLTAYEIDPLLAGYLQITMEACLKECEAAGVNFSYNVIQSDFIASTVLPLSLEGTLFSREVERYNCAILNPPYRKINANSVTRKLLRSVGIETSNLYTAFLWLVIKLLVQGGEMVAITPRSFCNGPYFRPFRYELLHKMALRRVHIFDSRTKAFSENDILQENIIFQAIKDPNRKSKIEITSSSGPEDEFFKSLELDYEQVVQSGNPELFIHIAPDELDQQIGRQLNGARSSLGDLNLTVSTGRVVEFRATHLLQNERKGEHYPLIFPGNLKNGQVSWPRNLGKKPVALSVKQGVEELVVPSGYYVLVKRFSSKEEKRRIVAAVFDPNTVPAEYLGFENHLNYFHRGGQGLPFLLARGLAAFLNSTLVDQFFRQFSGHTQVNAADLRRMSYPSEAQLLALGAKVDDLLPGEDHLDQLVLKELTLGNDELNPTGENALFAKKRISEALEILRALKIPRAQQNDRSALTLLALLDVKPKISWKDATNPLLGITEMMDYFKKYYGVTYAPNTRETVRRQTMHQFVQLGLCELNPDVPARPVHSPYSRYQIDPTALELLRTFGSDQWERNLKHFMKTAKTIERLHAKERLMSMLAIKLPGGQNVLIKKVLEEFCPRFTPGGVIAFLDDAGGNKIPGGYEYLEQFGVSLDRKGKLPDLVVHHVRENWLVLIEAVESHGLMNQKRHNELKEIFGGSLAGLIFVTAFETRRAMVKYLSEIAWETEVWVAESPSHLIHFNGERFLGPHEA